MATLFAACKSEVNQQVDVQESSYLVVRSDAGIRTRAMHSFFGGKLATASNEVNTNLKVELDPRVSSACAGLDNILNGGFPKGRIYLVEGDPGAGKTTLAVQFVRDGVSRGERALYITLSESRADLMHAAHSHGLSLDELEIVELLPDEPAGGSIAVPALF